MGVHQLTLLRAAVKAVFGCAHLLRDDMELLLLLQPIIVFAFAYFYIRRSKDLGKHERLDFDSLTDFECWTWFRFHREDIPVLVEKLQIPDVIKTKSRYVFSGREALLVCLWRLHFPCKWDAGAKFFGRGRSALSEINTYMLEYLTYGFSHLLRMPPYYSNPATLRKHADAINSKCPLSNVGGFIDGTLRRICRPRAGQRACYNGHKKHHGLKWQNVIAPDGIIIDQWGPAEGRRSDIWMLRESQLVPHVRQYWRFEITPATLGAHTPSLPGAPLAHFDGQGDEAGRVFIQYCVFGDKGYFTHHTGAVISPYKREEEFDLSPAEKRFNAKMSKARIAVEWGFLKTVQKFAYLDNHKQMKLWGTPISHYYEAATLLTNFHSCLYGNQTAKYFGVEPPSLDEYLEM